MLNVECGILECGGVCNENYFSFYSNLVVQYDTRRIPVEFELYTIKVYLESPGIKTGNYFISGDSGAEKYRTFNPLAQKCPLIPRRHDVAPRAGPWW